MTRSPLNRSVAIGRRRFLAGAGILAAGLAGASLLGGCGGHSSSSSDDTTPVYATIDWPARSRDVNATSSALSCLISLQSGNPTTGGSIDWTIDRDTSKPGAYTQNWTSPSPVRPGANKVSIQFFARPGAVTVDTVGTNPIVASYTANVTINKDGTGIGPFTIASSIASVTIPAGQTVNVGNTGTISFSAFDSTGAQIALTQGSAFFNVTPASMGTAASNVDQSGDFTGVYLGPTTVTATVDGITSSPGTVYSIVGTNALTTTSDGLQYRQMAAGSGTGAASGDTVSVRYALYLSADGNLDSGNYTLVQSNFDTTAAPDPYTFTVGSGVIPGFSEGVTGLAPGGERILVVPPSLGYGDTPPNGIPANATLIYLVQRTQ